MACHVVARAIDAVNRVVLSNLSCSPTPGAGHTNGVGLSRVRATRYIGEDNLPVGFKAVNASARTSANSSAIISTNTCANSTGILC